MCPKTFEQERVNSRRADFKLLFPAFVPRCRSVQLPSRGTMLYRRLYMMPNDISRTMKMPNQLIFLRYCEKDNNKTTSTAPQTLIVSKLLQSLK